MLDQDTIAYVCTACAAEMRATLPPQTCPKCGAEAAEAGFPTAESLRIAAQNDRFRAGLLTGQVADLKGRVVATAAVTHRGRDFLTEAIIAVASDSTFTPENDPHQDHGFGIVTVKGVRLYWKIDLYDLDLTFGSPDPANRPAPSASSPSWSRQITDAPPDRPAASARGPVLPETSTGKGVRQ